MTKWTLKRLLPCNMANASLKSLFSIINIHCNMWYNILELNLKSQGTPSLSIQKQWWDRQLFNALQWWFSYKEVYLPGCWALLQFSTSHTMVCSQTALPPPSFLNSLSCLKPQHLHISHTTLHVAHFKNMTSTKSRPKVTHMYTTQLQSSRDICHHDVKSSMFPSLPIEDKYIRSAGQVWLRSGVRPLPDSTLTPRWAWWQNSTNTLHRWLWRVTKQALQDKGGGGGGNWLTTCTEAHNDFFFTLPIKQ